MVIMVEEFVIVKKVGKDQSAIFQSLNVKCQHAPAMEDVLRENVIANEGLKDLFVNNVSILYIFKTCWRMSLIIILINKFNSI